MAPSTEQREQNSEASRAVVFEAVQEQNNILLPKPVETFVPQDAAKQKELFLAGTTRNPSHVYDKLEAATPEEDARVITELADSLAPFAKADPLKYDVYTQFANTNVLTHEFIAAARDTHSSDDEVAHKARQRFMELNIELYGEPDKDTFDALINESMQRYEQKNLSPEASKIRDELFELLPKTDTQIERYKPSSETVAKMKEIAEYLYGGMLAHIPADKETFNPEELAEIFREIIRDEFEESAADWRVVLVDAESIGVSVNEKLVKVPKNRKPVPVTELRSLIAHELGVHMLCSVIGEETDIPPLRTGLSRYYDAEEGTGKVMGQAVNGKYEDSGIPYYQVAGLMYFSGMDFRATHEIMWRMNLLKKIADNEAPTEASIEAARSGAYKTVSRISRGTDELPWFKDLAYYNGATKMWKYCEMASDDPEQFMFVLLGGKKDATNPSHRRVVMEAHTP